MFWQNLLPVYIVQNLALETHRNQFILIINVIVQTNDLFSQKQQHLLLFF